MPKTTLLRIIAILVLLGMLSACKVIPTEPTPASTLDPDLTGLPTELPESAKLVDPSPAETGLDELPFPTPSSFESAAAGAKALEARQQIPPYTVLPNDITYMPNFARTEGCQWQGVAGQVFGSDGIPLQNIVVNLGWSVSGKVKTNTGMTGNATAYGPGGYEVDITNTPFTSTHNLWIQAKDLSGAALTEKIYLDTYSDCTMNLIVVNIRYQGTEQLYMPVIGH